jgi:hypothetical protein
MIFFSCDFFGVSRLDRIFCEQNTIVFQWHTLIRTDLPSSKFFLLWLAGQGFSGQRQRGFRQNAGRNRRSGRAA